MDSSIVKNVRLIAIGIGIAIAVAVGVAFSFETMQNERQGATEISSAEPEQSNATGKKIVVELSESVTAEDKP